MIRIHEAQEAPFYQARSVAFLSQKPVSFWDGDGECYVAIPQGEDKIPGVVLSQAYHAFGPEIYNPDQERASWPDPGSVSHGTMRAEDLIPKFMFLLERHDYPVATNLITEYAGYGWPYSMSGLGFGDPFDDKQNELSGDLLRDLFEALNEIAPPGTYFGAHVGDGSDYGFWSHEEDDLQMMLQDLEAEVDAFSVVVSVYNANTEESDFTTVAPNLPSREIAERLQGQIIEIARRILDPKDTASVEKQAHD